MARSFLIVGMGRFGKHMAKSLTAMDNEVLAIDISEDRVNSALKYVTDARIGDATDEQFLKELGINNFDVCICAIGDNFQASLETTCLMHELGANYVFARANRDLKETGLRAIPRRWLELFERIEGERFEYETNMLLMMKRWGIDFVEQPITTVYDEEDYSSHYNAVKDSWRIFRIMFKGLFKRG